MGRPMRTLVYTISNFSPNASDCIDLMYSSLKINKNTDFCVIANTNPPNDFRFKTIVDERVSRDCYVGFLKYSDMVPKEYAQYVYLDSDILYFGEIDQLYSNKQLSIVRDHGSMTSTWFYYKNHDLQDLDRMKITQAVNAGSFAFKDISFLKRVRSLYEPYIEHNLVNNAILEQASFNYVIAKIGNFSFEHFHDLTDMSLLYASKKELVENKCLYHFCGFKNSMIEKYQEMKNLYDKYQRKNS
jgi:alpha-N-acetylglucosamine transferase